MFEEKGGEKGMKKKIVLPGVIASFLIVFATYAFEFYYLALAGSPHGIA